MKIDEETDRLVDGPFDLTDRWTNGKKDGQTDGQTGKSEIQNEDR